MDPVIITLSGEYDIERQPELRRALAPYYTHPYVVIDLTPISFMDSTCLCEFIRMRKHRQEASIRPATYIVNNNRFGKLFRFLGLHEIFTVVDTLDEAVAQTSRKLQTA